MHAFLLKINLAMILKKIYKGRVSPVSPTGFNANLNMKQSNTHVPVCQLSAEPRDGYNLTKIFLDSCQQLLNL